MNKNVKSTMAGVKREPDWRDIGLLLITANRWIYETPLTFSKIHEVAKKSGFNLCNPTELAAGKRSIFADEHVVAIYKSIDVFPNITMYSTETNDPKINKIILIGDKMHADDNEVGKQLNDAISVLCQVVKHYKEGENSDDNNNRVLQVTF